MQDAQRFMEIWGIENTWKVSMARMDLDPLLDDFPKELLFFNVYPNANSKNRRLVV